MSLWWCTHTFRPSGKRMTVLHDGKRCSTKREANQCVLYQKGWDFNSCRSAGAVVRVGGKMRETRAAKIKKAPKMKKASRKKVSRRKASRRRTVRRRTTRRRRGRR